MSSYIDNLPESHREQVMKWFNKTSAEEQIKSYAYMSEHYDNDFKHARSSDTCVDMLLDMLPSTEDDTPLRVLDAGCGTGFAGEHLRKAHADRKVHLMGMDYSPEMLEKARGKGLYDLLFEADFGHPFDMPAHDAAKSDGLVASGIFVENHVEPCYMVNMAQHLRIGGIAVFSVRDNFYERRSDEMDQAVKDSGFEVVKRERHAYWKDGTVSANYMVLRKVC